MVDEKKLDLVRKLLAKAASDAATEEERETYNTKAAELMALYRIENAMLAASGDVVESIVQRVVQVGQPYGMAKGVLLDVVGKANDVHVLLNVEGSGAWAKVPHAVMVGFPSDLDRVEMIYTGLLLQATPLMRMKPTARMDTPTFRYNLLTGFTDAVHHRFAEIKRRTRVPEPATGPSVALVLRDRRKQVEDAFAAMFPHTKKTQGRQAGAGYHSGYEAGKNADLGQTRVGGRRELSR